MDFQAQGGDPAVGQLRQDVKLCDSELDSEAEQEDIQECRALSVKLREHIRKFVTNAAKQNILHRQWFNIFFQMNSLGIHYRAEITCQNFLRKIIFCHIVVKWD